VKGLGYYAAMAQILPLLLVVVVLELRFLTPVRWPERKGEWAIWILNFLLLFLVIEAEVAALQTLKEERQAEWRDDLIESAWLIEICWIVTLAIAPQVQEQRRATREKRGVDAAPKSEKKSKPQLAGGPS
jgi:hypothetical protein